MHTFMYVCLVKAMVFPVVMYGCESWTVKKAERQRIDAFVQNHVLMFVLLERELQPTPVFLPGEFHEHRSLESYSAWD